MIGAPPRRMRATTGRRQGMKRYIYAFDTPEAARDAIAQLRQRGIAEARISLIARSDIELEKVPAEYLDARTDFTPALGRGAAYGGITGLFAGLVAVAIPPLGIALSGPVLLAFLAGGATLGAWSSAMMGSTVPDEVRRKFDDEIEAGRSLVVVDDDGSNGIVVTDTLAGLREHLLWQSAVEEPSV
jgi:hypothetical protein